MSGEANLPTELSIMMLEAVQTGDVANIEKAAEVIYVRGTTDGLKLATEIVKETPDGTAQS